MTEELEWNLRFFKAKYRFIKDLSNYEEKKSKGNDKKNHGRNIHI